jgi:ribonuclease BN (tRNA processing enzyme)
LARPARAISPRRPWPSGSASASSGSPGNAGPRSRAVELEIVEFAEGTIWDAEGLRISAFEVDHRPVAPAFGFLFESAESRVAFSGDTTVCDNLVR